MSDETRRRVGEYAIERKLGEGGMGVVYLARDTRLGRKVALKTMKAAAAADRDNRARFLREARAAAAVEHDNIVPIWGVGEAVDGTPYMVMPVLQGEPLDARLKRDPKVPVELILKVAREVAAGLAAAHAEGLIHRDIKPANIWLECDPKDPARRVRRCKVLDFGLARSADAGAQITVRGAMLGTPAYMAPEQARGAVDHRADLFSLGVVLYQMAAGVLPFKGGSELEMVLAIANDTPARVRKVNRELPGDVADLIDWLLNKRPEDRPQAAAEVCAFLEAHTDPPPRPSRSETPPVPDRTVDLPIAEETEELPEPGGRAVWGWVILLLIVVAVVPLGWALAGWLTGR